MAGRKLARRACDACKIRKVKCSETSPCDGCRNANIPCTWLRQSQPRGPRRLRDATLQEIRKAQDILQTQSLTGRRGNSKSNNVHDPDPPPEPSTEVAQLVLYLCVYRVQLYPVWPVVKVERLIASLQSESPDIEVFALAYALAAATATRTQSTDLSISKRNHAQILEQKCQNARSNVPPGRPPNLTTVRIAFFLHIYYESIEPNSMKSMLYLREAVTIATMIGLHKESYYSEVPSQEREIRRRVLWLLFITERVIAVLYEQPITLRTRIDLPSTIDTDEADVLAGFRRLALLFRTLDEAGMFSLLDELDVEASPSSNGFGTPIPSTDFSSLIEQHIVYRGYVPPVQALDFATTRCWMHILNLRLHQLSAVSTTTHIGDYLSTVLDTGMEMVNVIETSPIAVVEAHGNALKLKLSTITAVIEDSTFIFQRELQNEDGLCQRCAHLAMRLKQALAARLVEIAPYHTKSPISMTRSSPGVSSLSPLRDKPSIILDDLVIQSPTSTALSPWLTQDFALTNNYEGLFDAVDQAGAGVPSSDSVDDLFSSAHLEHHSTFDDPWPNFERPQLAATGICSGINQGLSSYV